MHACALISDAEFGSALNIETLVAAAERRETPIEVTYIFRHKYWKENLVEVHIRSFLYKDWS